MNKFTFGVVLMMYCRLNWQKDDPNSAHNDRRYKHLPADVVPDCEKLKSDFGSCVTFLGRSNRAGIIIR